MKRKSPKINKLNMHQQLLYFDLFSYKMIKKMALIFLFMSYRLYKLSEEPILF